MAGRCGRRGALALVGATLVGLVAYMALNPTLVVV
jgi:hypothetical protein